MRWIQPAQSVGTPKSSLFFEQKYRKTDAGHRDKAIE
jgi:hypothetical protein